MGSVFYHFIDARRRSPEMMDDFRSWLRSYGKGYESLAGGGATDDPEGEAVLADVRNEAGTGKDIHVLLSPPDAHVTINALQRGADVVVQKSLKEGFNLTVTEALWKGKPVIGGDAGGIRLQTVSGASPTTDSIYSMLVSGIGFAVNVDVTKS